MPSFNLKGVKIGKYVNTSGTITYTNQVSAGDAMTADIEMSFAEGKLFAEGGLAEYLRRATGGKISLGVKYILAAAQKIMFGKTDKTRTVGPASVKQVETATAAGTVSTAGNASVTVTSALFDAPEVVAVPVELSDDASAIALAIRTALGANENVAAHYTVGGSGASVVLTAKVEAANDATLNIAIADGTGEGASVGVTTAATSANTTAGVAPGGTITGLLSAMSDVPNYVGVAFYADDMIDGVTMYTCVFVYKSLFSDPAMKFKTYEEGNVIFNTPVTTGTIMPDDSAGRNIIEVAVASTEALAQAWVNLVLGIT